MNERAKSILARHGDLLGQLFWEAYPELVGSEAWSCCLLLKAAERTRDGLWSAIRRIIDLYRPDECRNLFKNAGYAA